MSPHNTKCWALIVHYGRVEPTKRAVAALLNNTPAVEQVVVIDNDQEQPFPGNASEKIRVVRPGKNLGYAGAINLGLGFITSQGAGLKDIVIVSNNDVVISSSAISCVRDYFTHTTHPTIAGLNTVVGKKQVSGLGILNLITGRSLLSQYHRKTRWWHRPYIHGAIFTASIETLIKSGPIPEDYFLYHEDVLFSRQAQSRGIALTSLSCRSVHHQDEARASNRDDQLYYLVRNGAMFLERHTPHLWRIYWRFVNRFRYIWHASLRHQTTTEALRHARHQRIGPRSV